MQQKKKIVYVIKSYSTEIFLQIDHIIQNFDREISKNEFVFFHYINWDIKEKSGTSFLHYVLRKKI